MPRFPVLHGWWIAIAQNVAPGRFHAREVRQVEEYNRRLLTSSDVPSFALAGTPSAATATRVAQAGMRLRKAGPFGLRRFGDGAVTSLHTTQRTPGGGELRVTSERSRNDVERESDGPERALMIHNFLAFLGLPADHAGVALREVPFSPGRTWPLLTVSEDAWRPCEIVIDGEPHEFERITIGDHWLAIGTVDDVDIAVEGHGFDPDRLELVRLDRPAG
ncbi:MAG: hypothetical protein ABSD78_16485 [Acidimicrobiales bacterium]